MIKVSLNNEIHLLFLTLLSDKAPAAPEPLPQRKRLVLQPRSVPVEVTSPAGSHSEEEASNEITEEAALKKIGEDLKEFFAVRNLEEAEFYFSSLPLQHHHLLVDKIVSTAVESKEDDAKLVSQFFVLAASKELCSAASFERGLTPVAEIIDDIAIDAPKAFQLFAMMIKGASLGQERLANLASKSSDSDKLLALASVVHDYPCSKKSDSSPATGSVASHQSPVHWGDPLLTSAPSTAISLSSHGSGSGQNYEVEWLRIHLNAAQEDLRLQQRHFEEEKILMNRQFEERQQNQRSQFDAERVFYRTQIKALGGYP